MFSCKKKTKILLSPVSGRAIKLEDVSDEVFSSGMLGRGFAVKPSEGVIYSPVSGKLENIADSLHAYSIATDDGIDILVHIGIDTVELGGRGFRPRVAAGDSIKAGEVIATFEPESVKSAGYSPDVIVVITGSPASLELNYTLGDVRGGESAVIKIL